MSRHIIVTKRDSDFISQCNSDKKNRCIQKKDDYLSCVKSYPRIVNHKSFTIYKNNCNSLFWNWYKNCYDSPKND